MFRKYCEPYSLDNYTTRMIDRVKKWGFNSIGAFSSSVANPATKAANFPYVSFLPLGQGDELQDILGVHGTWDPFGPSNRAKGDPAMATKSKPRAEDPLMIGYFLSNEPLKDWLIRLC